MQSEIYVVAGAAIGAIAAYVTARTTTRSQIAIAEQAARKDISLQRERLFDERMRAEWALERDKLDRLHRILSRIEFENSQTMSVIQSDSGLGVDEFRRRYMDNCERFHEAMAIADIYYPRMREGLGQVYGQTNIFWGNQENLLRTDLHSNRQAWEHLLSEVLKASEAIRSRTRRLKDDIAERAATLSGNISERT